MPEDHFIDGTKVANIQVSTKYPIVSAFEFEFLKSERAVLERLDNCTIYMIAQRPLTYFDEVILKDGYIYFKISDAEHQPLACRINLVSAGICTADETVDIEVSFLSKTPGTEQPFRDVGAIKIYKLDGSFVVWWSPQKKFFMR